MPTEILQQLRTLREGIVEALKKDPRYLTLAALDKTITEISGVLSASGLLPPEPPQPPEPLRFEPGGASRSARLAALAPQAASPMPTAPASAPVALAAATPEAHAAHIEPEAEPVPMTAKEVAAPPAIPGKPKKSFVLKPLVETAAIVAAGALAAEAYSEAKGKPMGKSAPKDAAPAAEDDGDSDEESEPAASHEAHDKAHEPPEQADEHDAHAAKSAHAPHEAEEDAEETEGESDGTDGDDTPTDGEAHAVAEGHEPAEHAVAEDGSEKEEHGSVEHESEPGAEAHPSEAHAYEEHEAETHGSVEHASETADPAGVIPEGKASGYKAMGAKPDAAQYQPAISVRFGKLPNKVDLRPLMTPIEDQGETNSCVANAVAGAYEYWIKKASKQNQQISRLFVYYNARWRDNAQDKDEGSVIQLAMEGLAKFGACSEKVWPFDTHLVLKKPGADAYQDGAAYRVHDMAQVPLKIGSWKQALAEGKPIVFGCELFDSFDECSKRGGVVPMPAPDDLARKKHSGHSMCAVGYSDSEKVFIVRNSWGAGWGDKGYCYMPYSYLMSSKFNDGDCWVFVPKVPSQPPREVWSDTTDPVTNSGKGVDFPIETHTVADYEHIAIDLFARIRRPFNATIVADYGEYVSWAGRGLWSEFEKFDVATYLASTAALTGVASIAAEAYLSETHVSETETSEASETVGLMSEESSREESSEDETSEDESSEDETSEETDAAAEDETDEDTDEDTPEAEAAGDEDKAEHESDDESDEDKAEDDADGDKAEDDTAEDESEDADDDTDAEEDASEDDAEEDDDAAEDDEAEGDDDAEDDDADSEDDDEGDDEEGDDEEGDDDEGDDGDSGDGEGDDE